MGSGPVPSPIAPSRIPVSCHRPIPDCGFPPLPDGNRWRWPGSSGSGPLASGLYRCARGPVPECVSAPEMYGPLVSGPFSPYPESWFRDEVWDLFPFRSCARNWTQALPASSGMGSWNSSIEPIRLRSRLSRPGERVRVPFGVCWTRWLGNSGCRACLRRMLLVM